MVTSSSTMDGQPARPRGALESVGRIRDLIVSGEYQPGERLPTERELAKSLGVSRGAIREAIRELAALNIVHSKQGAGTFVSTLDSDRLMAPLDFALVVDPDSVAHLLELRRLVEPLTAGLAATRITPRKLAALRGLMNAYEESFEQSDLQSMIALDEEIHLAVAAASGNPLLAAILRSLPAAARRARVVTASDPATPPLSRAELSALMQAIEARDPYLAQAAMTRHLARIELSAHDLVMDGTPAGSAASSPRIASG